MNECSSPGVKARINRNIVECKSSCFGHPPPIYLCINRNIVECKYVSGKSCLILLSRINRNIVECKFSNGFLPLVSRLVLIETLWNVNVETFHSVIFTISINRNIVECKCILLGKGE